MTKPSSFRTAALAVALLLTALLAPAMPASAQPAPPPPAAAPEAENEESADTEPTFDDPTSTVTIPEVDGVEFLIDDQVVEAGPHAFQVQFRGLNVTVTARSTSGGPAPTPNSWKHLFPEVIEMPAPGFNDVRLGVQAPGRNGVQLFAEGWHNGDPLRAKSFNDFSEFAGKTVTIRAKAVNPSITLLVGVTEWTHAFPARLVEPTWDDRNSSVTIPAIAGIEYLIDGAVAASGPHHYEVPFRGKKITVTAQGTNDPPVPGPQTWTHTFPEVIEMPAPGFNDVRTGVQAPGRNGVQFFADGWHNGEPLRASSFNDFSEFAGKTVTVRAQAVNPSITLLVGTTEWTHTFPAAQPDYPIAAGDEFNDTDVSKQWRIPHESKPSKGKSVYRRENLTVKDGKLDVRISRHCLASETEEVSEANRHPEVCPPGTVVRYSTGRINSGLIYGRPASMEVRARLDDDHHGITSTGWAHNDQKFCNNGVPASDIAEFDTMEIWATEYSTSFSHMTCYDGGRYHTNGVRVDQHIPGAWHTWRMEWDGYTLRYFFDGKPMLGPTGAYIASTNLEISQEKFASIINDHRWQMVISVNTPPNGNWAPWIDDTKAFPDRHDLYDYIRWQEFDPAKCAPVGEIARFRAGRPDLGAVTGCEVDTTSGGGRVQQFENGRVYWSPSTGAHVVQGAILQKFLASGGEDAFGLPVADELRGLRDGGASQPFTKATFFWSPATGVHFARGEILKRYGAMGWENSVFGYPTSDEICGMRDGGCHTRFQRENGHIYWSWPTGAHSIQGAILARYGAMGYENGVFGYPTSDEICGLVGGGCHNRFQRESGHIYWSPASGSWGVQGAIYAHYARNGWEWGRLGYPTGPETCRNILGAYECSQTFQRGKVTWDSRTGARG